MKVTLTDLTAEEAEAALAALSALSNKEVDTDDDDEEEKPKKKSKKKPVEEDDDADDSDDDSDDDDGDDSEVDDDGPTLAQVMDAFKKLLKKHKGDKKKAIPILKQFKVKSPNDLDEDDYAAVLKAISKEMKK